MAKEISAKEFMDKLDHPFKEGIENLRTTIKKCDKKIIEEIKWNAPSFKLDDHFATFKLFPPKNIQIVLHTGVKKKETPKQFHLDDENNLIKWATSDRCTITIQSNKEAKEFSKEISKIIKSWIKQL